ncbi:hypothetical protein B0H14DRAFT_2562917 [Mycena olivaceomarginata]|nr:hypothetical protein B0H14DRAFT_2562917 [Mycena olivaceomarginata]
MSCFNFYRPALIMLHWDPQLTEFWLRRFCHSSQVSRSVPHSQTFQPHELGLLRVLAGHLLKFAAVNFLIYGDVATLQISFHDCRSEAAAHLVNVIAAATALTNPQTATNLLISNVSLELPELDGTQWASLDFNFNFEFEDLVSSSAALVHGGLIPDYWGPANLNALVTAEMFAPMVPVQEASMLAGWELTALDELLTSSLFEGSSTDTLVRDFSLDFGVNQLPTLPAPPSPSVSAPSPPNVPPMVVPRKRRAEVDEANILHSSRVRIKPAKLQASNEAPTSKKRLLFYLRTLTHSE